MTLNNITRRHLAAASPVALALGMLALTATPSFASCTLGGTPSVWSDSNGNWSVGGNWTPSGEPAAGANVCITDGSSTVDIDTNPTVGSFQIGAGNSVSLNSSQSLVINGPSWINDGSFTLNASGGNSIVQLNGDTTLSGLGTVTMTNGAGTAFLRANGHTLTNSSTIVGDGLVNDTGGALNNSGSQRQRVGRHAYAGEWRHQHRHA